MSKKSWYKRTHQFTPYTKADGQAVSDEFDAIQASFERIPEMRDDGTGFKVSPIIPTPTNPKHPVTLEMLTQSENSVNTARDTAIEKAKQATSAANSASDSATVAINKAADASKDANIATQRSRSASDSESMARKWASNPVDSIVLDNKYSALHYATKARQSAESLRDAESNASQSATTANNAATTATQKAEEAKNHADRAQRIAGGKVEYGDILNIPRANTARTGITQHTNSYDGDSEELSLTQKGAKALKALIDALTRNLGNYIPNSKKSNAVDSNSADTVATSAAVKAANDNANTRVPLAYNNSYALIRATDYYYAGLEVHRTGTAGSWASRIEALPDRRWKFWNRSDGNGYEQYVKAENGTFAFVEDLTAYVPKSGGTMTGQLTTPNVVTMHKGHGAYVNQYNSGAPYLVEADGSLARDCYHPFVKGKVRKVGQYGTAFSFGYTTKQGSGDGFGQGIIQLAEDNGSFKHWVFDHDGSFAVTQGHIVVGGSDYPSVRLTNTANKVLLLENRPDNTGFIANLVYRTSGQNEAYIQIPKKNGTMALQEDFSYQKVGNFEIRKYPDGTMIQTYLIEQYDLKTWTEKSFSWAQAFISAPMMFAYIQTSYGASHSCGVNIQKKSNNTTCYYYEWEVGSPDQGNVKIQFLAIGRWK